MDTETSRPSNPASTVSTTTPPDPAWLDRSLFPFESHSLDLPEGRVHYVDEGPRDGLTLLCLHGNPTWSFLYRDVISALRTRVRVVAPDLLGFGLSEKPEGFSYLPRDHARVVEQVVDELDLDDVVLLVHDWGGPIGLDYATRHPERIRGVVVTNSWMWPVEERTGRWFSRLLGGVLGRAAILRFNAFARFVVPSVYADRSRLDSVTHRHYLAPLSTPDERKGSWVFPRELLGSRTWLGELWSRRDALSKVPVLLVWGLADPGLGESLQQWQTAFPHARVVTFEDCGHYVPEEKGRALAAAVDGFVETI